MIPKNDSDVRLLSFDPRSIPSKAYNLGLTSRRRAGSFLDQREAMKQAIFLILNTERYEYPIYPWSYGAEMSDLLGQPVPFVLPEIKRRVTEALLQDDRITDIDSWEFDVERGKVNATFVVHTLFGDIPTEQEVRI